MIDSKFNNIYASLKIEHFIVELLMIIRTGQLKIHNCNK